MTKREKAIWPRETNQMVLYFQVRKYCQYTQIKVMLDHQVEHMSYSDVLKGLLP